MQKHLLIMRHAKAEQFGASDHERGLADRGERDAAAAGSWLAREEYVVDHALVSSSARTLATWKLVADNAGWEFEPDIDSSLYAGGPDTALDLIRDVPPGVRGVIVIGHNPTMAYLAQLLDDGEGDPEASTALATDGFPTSAIAVFAVKGEWADIEDGSLELVGHHVGRG